MTNEQNQKLTALKLAATTYRNALDNLHDVPTLGPKIRRAFAGISGILAITEFDFMPDDTELTAHTSSPESMEQGGWLKGEVMTKKSIFKDEYEKYFK